jgi:exosortase
LQTAADLTVPLSTPSPTAPRVREDVISPATWAKAGVVALAFIALYWRNLDRLWDKTNPFTGDPNWYHAICVPLIGLYYLFLHRDVLVRTPVEPLLAGNFGRARWASAIATSLLGCALFAVSKVLPQTESLAIIAGLIGTAGKGLVVWGGLVALLDWGLSTLLIGLWLTVWAIHPLKNDFAWDTAMILTLFGTVLTLCGWKIMRIAWFPIVFLFCALPWPPLVYSKIASPLQALAAQVSVVILQLAGIDSSFQGTKIFIAQFDPLGLRQPDRALDVAEACAGLRSLMTFISVAAAVAFLSSRPLWQKLIIAFSAIPIAIGCNVLRVGGQGILDTYVGKEWSEGFAHQFAGMVMLLPAFFLILLVCFIVDHLFIEEADAPQGLPAKAAE